jgi:hypothetical protein
MKNLLFGALLICFSATAFAGGTRDGYGDKPLHSMPEPAGIIELAGCAAGLGVWAWRRR